VSAAAGTIGAIATLRHQPLKAKLAGLAKQVGADLALLERRHEDAIRSARQEPRQVGLAHRQRQRAQVVAVRGKQVERVQLHLVVMLAGDEGVEVGHAVNSKHHGLTINDEMVLPDLARGLDDPGVAIGPVVPVHCEKAHAIVLPLHQQAEAVVFDFMKPVRTVWNLGPARRQAEPELLGHAG
jgi:hypothetical protein